MKTFMSGLLLVIVVASSVGLAGEGPGWMKMLGSGTLFFMLTMILIQISNIPTMSEQKSLMNLIEKNQNKEIGMDRIASQKEKDVEG